MKPPSYTPEGWGAYGQGYADGHREARTEAFAAIRRAAEVAREREAQGDDLWDRGFPHFAHPQYNKARDIRRAIRAAIGSDKT
jgi:hypothetical protein